MEAGLHEQWPKASQGGLLGSSQLRKDDSRGSQAGGWTASAVAEESQESQENQGDHQTRAHKNRMVLMVVNIGREAGLHERWPKYNQGKADKQH